MKAIVVLSGGMDSTVCFYYAKHTFGSDEIGAISFNYGQRHKCELAFAAETCEFWNVPHHIVDLTSVRPMLKGSALTDEDVKVPEGHYEAESMQDTVVPNRNMMMGSIASAWAVAEGAECIVMGMHAGDHAIYPDCREEFVGGLANLVFVGNEGSPKLYDDFQVWAPFIKSSKAEIVTAGQALHVPWDMTWTCYNGGELHCGRCSTCVERLEAFHEASVTDPTTYEDREYWKAVCGISE